MSDDFDPLTTEQAPPPQLSHRRILVIIALIIVAGAVAGSAFADIRFGFGVLTGGVMSYINYFWQRNSTRAIFAHAVQGEQPVLLAVRYILRYVALGLVVGFFYATGAFPVAAVILGLAAFALAVVVEGLIGIFASSNRQVF